MEEVGLSRPKPTHIPPPDERRARPRWAPGRRLSDPSSLVVNSRDSGAEDPGHSRPHGSPTRGSPLASWQGCALFPLPAKPTGPPLHCHFLQSKLKVLRKLKLHSSENSGVNPAQGLGRSVWSRSYPSLPQETSRMSNFQFL